MEPTLPEAVIESKPITSAFRFRSHDVIALPSGALLWPARRMLIVADLHLEKLASFARGSSMLLPPYDTRMTLNSLRIDLERTGATSVIALGDSLHRDWSADGMLDEDRQQLRALVEPRDWIWVSGNHDPSPHGLGGRCVDEVVMDGLTFRHEPTKGISGMISGHLHPGAKVSVGGRSHRARCFVDDGDLLILPAYGASTGAMNVLSAPFVELVDMHRASIRMMGRDVVHHVPTRRLVLG